MKKRQIVNIINFIRGCEPRTDVDLVEPVREQINLLNKYGFKGTFLLQYDALCEPAFVDLLKNNCQNNVEFGVWLEIVEPMVKAAGLEWRGRFPWDWTSDVGFSVGYTLSEREVLIDVIFEKFKKTFGYYPRSMGSWMIDAHSLDYANMKYGLDASCNCKDQLGTDGYTLWGGYYNQAYYPSVFNMLSPAQTADKQIKVPVFRMLGSDPVYQYNFSGVVSLEPVYTGKSGGGGVKEWVDWYLKENFNRKCLAFSYTQVGQENSFGWPAMCEGLTYQFAQLAKLVADGVIEIETLGESGRWFKDSFELTPATSIVSDTDWKGENRLTLWYNCRNYRASILMEDSKFFFRDIYLFRQFYPEKCYFETSKMAEHSFDNLPIIDGNLFSGDGIQAGLYPFVDGKQVTFIDHKYEETDDSTAVLTFNTNECGALTVTFSENFIRVTVSENSDAFTLEECHSSNINRFVFAKNTFRGLELKHNNFEYYVNMSVGKLEFDKNVVIRLENGVAEMRTDK